MRALKSWLGLGLALLYACVFGAAYYRYVRADGDWREAQALFLVALPYTLTMVKLVGSVDFSGDVVASVIKAAAFGCGLAYVAGALVEYVLRLAFGLVRRAFGRA